MSTLILPGHSDFERTLGRRLFDIGKYTRRQQLALERPEEHEAFLNFASNEPWKREVEVHEGVQLVSILTVDLDDKPEWHARVGWQEAKGYFVPLRAWTTWMEEPAQRVLDEMMALPRDVEAGAWKTTVRTAGRPSTIHKFLRLSGEEREYMLGVQGSIVQPRVWVKEPRRLAS